MTPYVLYIEDDLLQQRMCRNFLEKAGYSVQVAHTLRMADLLFCEQRPELILADLTLPDATGPEIVQSLRQRYDGQVPILVIADDLAPFRKDGTTTLADGSLEKPFTAAELTNRMQVLIEEVPQAMPVN
ncbi:response regulator transcription factor [Larkinella soli]|uniref:response regulator transcription factor n=1 Tax=Larkinella soli TaxID=1770527 RepID=UPI000FFC48B5|nr:response regulator [Larkinella soli]